MTVTKASLDALAADVDRRRKSVETRALKALKDLRREGAAVSISAVARRANVARTSIHRRPKLMAQIEAHRTLAVVPSETRPTAGRQDSVIIAALRRRLIAKDAQIAALRTELRERDTVIAVLQGELERLNHGDP